MSDATPEGVRQKKMRQIQALIDKANSTTFDAERDSLLAKADTMMAAYAIEQFELEFHKAAKDRDRQPIMQEMTYGHTGSWEADQMLHQVFYDLCELTGVLVGYFGISKSKVVGFPEDISYVDMLMTGVTLHLATTIEPKPQPELTLDENLVALKEAGQKWQRIYELLITVHPDDPHFDKGRIDDASWARAKSAHDEAHREHDFPGECAYARGWVRVDRGGKTYYFQKVMPRNIGVWFTGVYTRYCKENERDRMYSNPDVWRRNFQQGYILRVRERIAEMRRARNAAGSGKELVLVSMKDRLQEALWDFFPDQRPHPPECDCELRCHARKCKNPTCPRTGCVAKRKPVKASRYGARSIKEQKVDWAAQRAGARAGESADLVAGRNNVPGGTRGEIG